MRKLIHIILLLFALPAPAGNVKDAVLVTLYEDSAGHLLRTREVKIYRSGRVVEETYNFLSTSGPSETHRIKKLKRLTKPQLTRVVASLSENGFESLPTVLDLAKGIVPDAPHRRITAYEGGREHSVQWNNFNDDPSSRETIRFTAIFIEISLMVAPAPSI